MSQQSPLALARSWLWLVVVSVVASALTAFLVTSLTPATYASSVTLLVGPPLDASDMSINDILVGRALAPTYAQLATSQPVVEEVIRSTGADVSPEQLAADITTNVPTDSNLLTITVTSSDPSEAAALANGVAAALAAIPEKPTGTSARITLVVLDPATPPTAPIGTRPIVNAILGAGVGLLIGLGIVYVLVNLKPSGLRAGTPPTSGLAPD